VRNLTRLANPPWRLPASAPAARWALTTWQGMAQERGSRHLQLNQSLAIILIN
jgi:hypothetical protein